MATSRLEIMNMALGHLRQQPLRVEGERSEAGRNCALYYDEALKNALRAFDWPFARGVETPALVQSGPMPGWLYAYDMPAGSLVVRRILRGLTDEGAVPYVLMRLQGRTCIFTNKAAPTVISTLFVDDPVDYPPDFVIFLSLHLAGLLAMPVTGKAELAAALRKQVDEAGKAAFQSANNEDFNDDEQGAYPERDTPPRVDTALTIANLALGHIGAQPIHTFGERSFRADAARRFYRQAVDATLRAHDWPFARRIEPAVPIGPATYPGYRLAFEYPADALAIREIVQPNHRMRRERYQVIRSGNRQVIVTNAAAPKLRYTCRPDNEDDFDPEFVAAVSLQLAMLICVPITSKADLLRPLSGLLAAAMSRAQTSAANEDTNDINRDPEPDWIAARNFSDGWRDDIGIASGPPGAEGGFPGNGPITPQPPQVITVIVDGGNIGAGQ